MNGRPVFIIKCTKPLKSPWRQTIRAQEYLNNRLKRNRDKFKNVEKQLEKVFGGPVRLKQSIELALEMGKIIGVAVDRRAK